MPLSVFQLQRVHLCIPRPTACMCGALQVHPDGRRAYIGEESDRTRNGEIIMSHNKSFKSLPIRSWTGGAKVCPPHALLIPYVHASIASFILGPPACGCACSKPRAVAERRRPGTPTPKSTCAMGAPMAAWLSVHACRCRTCQEARSG